MNNSINWEQLLSKIKKIPRLQLWRHNTAGDLPNNQGKIDNNMIRELIEANKGRRGFTFTHHQLTKDNLEIIKYANQNGFTINASTESVETADYIMSNHNIPAVAVVSSKEKRRFFNTKSGRQVIVCPSTIHDDVTCNTCRICYQSNRRAIVAFPAHGTAKNKVDSKLNIN